MPYDTSNFHAKYTLAGATFFKVCIAVSRWCFSILDITHPQLIEVWEVLYTANFVESICLNSLHFFFVFRCRYYAFKVYSAKKTVGFAIVLWKNSHNVKHTYTVI